MIKGVRMLCSKTFCLPNNPWLPKADREHDIAALCERFQGGGHPFVGGVSFAPEADTDAIAAQRWILGVLRGETSP